MTASPSNQQNTAIKRIEAWFDDDSAPQVFALFGAAGTGKSFTANAVIEHLKARGGAGVKRMRKVAAGAFTGKAANVLRQKGLSGASTIHAMIYTPVVDEDTGDVHFNLRRDGPAAEADLILLDEMSMCPQALADDLLTYRKKILVLGDPYQLPPVNGQGAFTDREPDFLLTEIHRQAAESPIIRLATMIRNGDLPRRFGSVGDVHVLPLTAGTRALAMRPETRLLCGTHKVRYEYTAALRDANGYSGLLPHKTEPVVCRRNDRATGLFNGMLGMVRSNPRMPKSSPLFRLSVEMEDHPGIRYKGLSTSSWLFSQHIAPSGPKPILPAGTMEFDFGYVLTVHSFQGSEAPSVTVLDDSVAFRADRWRWLYTAVTRSSRELVLLLREDIGGSWRMPELAGAREWTRKQPALALTSS